MEITVSYSDSTFGYISVSTSKVLAGMKHKKKKKDKYMQIRCIQYIT